MDFKHTNRHGFLLGFVDFFTAGLFFLAYMPLGLQDEIEKYWEGGHRDTGSPTSWVSQHSLSTRSYGWPGSLKN